MAATTSCNREKAQRGCVAILAYYERFFGVTAV
jgi:hypothetical protein